MRLYGLQFQKILVELDRPEDTLELTEADIKRVEEAMKGKGESGYFDIELRDGNEIVDSVISIQ